MSGFWAGMSIAVIGQASLVIAYSMLKNAERLSSEAKQDLEEAKRLCGQCEANNESKENA